MEVVVDAYDDEDWDVLWWVRMRGSTFSNSWRTFLLVRMVSPETV